MPARPIRLGARWRSTRVEAVGAYTLLVLRNDGGDAGLPGQFFMLAGAAEPADAYLPRALSAAWADEHEIAFLLDVRGAGTSALATGAAVDRCWARWGTASSSRDGPAILVGGGIGAAILPWLVRRLPGPRDASCSASAARRTRSVRRWSMPTPRWCSSRSS